MVGAVVVAHVIGDVAAAAVVRAGEYDKSRKLAAIWWAAAMVKVMVLALWCCGTLRSCGDVGRVAAT